MNISSVEEITALDLKKTPKKEEKEGRRRKRERGDRNRGERNKRTGKWKMKRKCASCFG